MTEFYPFFLFKKTGDTQFCRWASIANVFQDKHYQRIHPATASLLRIKLDVSKFFMNTNSSLVEKKT